MSTVRLENSLAHMVRLLESNNPELVELLQAEDEQSFIEASDGILEKAIRRIEGGAKQYSDLEEPGLSRLLSDILALSGLRASAETDHNGHVDIVIENAFGGGWTYLGECKIYDGFEYHVKGCKQLLGYCSGRELRAFVLDFFKKPKMYKKLEDMRQRFDKEQPASQQGTSTDHKILGAFLTKHQHPNGREIELLHVGCAIKKATSKKKAASRN